MRRLIKLFVAGTLLFTVACEQPMDPVIESVNETKSLLKSHNWVLTDYQVTVKDSDVPPPVLLNSSDSLILAGNYKLNDMIPPGTDFPIYIMRFTDDNKILVDSANTGYFADQGGTYFVFNEASIRLKPDGVKKEIYDYYYNPDQRSMSFTLSEEAASRAIESVNDRLTKWVTNETPNQIGDAIAQKVYNSTKLQQATHDFIANAIAGKLSSITDFDPEHAADTLAAMIIDTIASLDWQSKLSDAINTELQKITSINADSLAPIIAQNIAGEIQSKFSVDNVYEILLPYLEGLASQDPETMANNISTLIVQAIGDVFSQQNLQQIITPIWEKFTDLDSTQVYIIAAKFTDIVQDNWLNPDTIANVFLPFTQKIDETPLSQLNALAQETTDSLQVHVNQLNENFPELSLSPDYDQIKTQIHGILVAAKPIIGVVGADSVALDIAQLILNNFLTTQNIENAFAAAIHYLQAIDPSTAASTIADWLVNIEQRVAPEIIQWLTDKLSPILEGFDPDFTAFTIAQKVNAFIDEHVTGQYMEGVVLNLLQKITDINTEVLANVIAGKILNSSIIQDGFSQENIASKLLPVLENIHNFDPTEISDKIADAISGVIKDVFTEQRISNIIAYLLYREAWNNVRIVNNFQEATIVISYE